MARPFPIGDQSEGINLSRFKGGASPRALFDLLNGWVNPKKIIKARGGAGTPIAEAPNTVGGIEFEGKIHVFAGAPVVNTDPLVELHVLRHPTDGAFALTTVHTAFIFLGRIYCSAEWADGTVRHFWLQGQPAWGPQVAYQFGQVVSPTVDNGFVYEITNDSTLPRWAAGVETGLSDEIEPVTRNGFKYRATAVAGSPARTGNNEPAWVAAVGAVLTEYDDA